GVLELVRAGGVGDGAGGRALDHDFEVTAERRRADRMLSPRRLSHGGISPPPGPHPPGAGPAASTRPNPGTPPQEDHNPMVRLQPALAERYTAASPADLAERIGAAKDTLGDRLFILGHHYQRDDVMRWADARGDSFRLSVLAQQRPEADYVVFCGV